MGRKVICEVNSLLEAFPPVQVAVGDDQAQDMVDAVTVFHATRSFSFEVSSVTTP